MNGNLSWGMFRVTYSDPVNCSTTALKKCMGRDSLLLFQYIALIKYLYMHMVVMSTMKHS